ncbi:hypothetical protein LQZ19_05880 [Treponema primitia]|uniref:hypothetical protein n=1 Tax=Treponema primitia TaxID=88058 RepID=UPI0039815D73
MMTDIEKTIEEARAAVLPFESWERLTGESGAAYAAFCVYRDFGAERNIRKAVEKHEGDAGRAAKRYRMWRGWSMQFKWRERAADYDQYLDHLKQAELRKTIEEQGRVHRMVTGKMLQVVSKKLDLMEPGELAQGTVTDWVSTAIRAEREAAGLTAGKDKPEGQTDKNGQITFIPDFEGL